MGKQLGGGQFEICLLKTPRERKFYYMVGTALGSPLARWPRRAPQAATLRNAWVRSCRSKGCGNSFAPGQKRH